MANDIGGVWRTIGGRRVFIKEGQDLASAMKESGKFKSASKGGTKKQMAEEENENKRMTKEDAYRQAAKELGYKRHTSDEKQWREIYERAQGIIKEHPEITEYENAKTDAWEQAAKELGYKRHTSNEKEYREIYERTQEILKSKEVEHELNKDTFSRFSKEYEKDRKKHTIDKNDINALNELADSGKDINDYYGLDDIAKDYIKNRRQEIGRNEFTKKADEVHKKTLDEKTRNLEDGKEIHDVFRQMDAKEMEVFAKQNPESIKKMQDYLKDKDNDEYEYNLYKQAKENPDSINPMTEMSTDWEDLDKRFKDRYEKENQKSDLMTAEQLKGKDREEQKEINKQYLKEQNKLAKEKNEKDDNQFTMYNSQYDKEVTVKKGADGKWVDSDGNKYMGYLSKQDVKQYFKGNWKESTEKRTASEIISSQMSKTKNAKIEVANALGLKYDNDNGWKSTSQLYKEQKGKDIANIAIDSSKADKYNAFVKKNYNREDKNFSDRADIDKYAKDNNLDADALYYMTKIASESDRTKLKKKAFELYKKQHPNTKKTIYSFEDDIK